MALIKTGIIISSICILLGFFLSIPAIHANPSIASNEVIGFTQGYFYIKAEAISLTAVVGIIEKKYSIKISGLESLDNQIINYRFKALSLEELLKGLLRYLKIKNYAFEFSDQKLTSVVIFPEAKNRSSRQIQSLREDKNRSQIVVVAVVKEVVESSQAESLGLMAGDLIIEYDGIRINSANQLVKEVEKKSAENQIEMITVREKKPMRLILHGGTIGVRITNTKISQTEYDSYF